MVPCKTRNRSAAECNYSLSHTTFPADDVSELGLVIAQTPNELPYPYRSITTAIRIHQKSPETRRTDSKECIRPRIASLLIPNLPTRTKLIAEIPLESAIAALTIHKHHRDMTATETTPLQSPAPPHHSDTLNALIRRQNTSLRESPDSPTRIPKPPLTPRPGSPVPQNSHYRRSLLKER